MSNLRRHGTTAVAGMTSVNSGSTTINNNSNGSEGGQTSASTSSGIPAASTTNAGSTTAKPAASTTATGATSTSIPVHHHTADSTATASGSAADDATTTLIKNILVPTSALQKPLESTLPALTSFTDIDKELYAFVALILRQFVLVWYARIAGDDIADRAFVYEVVHVIAHVTRSIEERIRKVELEMVLLDDIPFVLDSHLRDYRLARQKTGTAYAAGKSFEEMFHALQPHPALVPPAQSDDTTAAGTPGQPSAEDEIERRFLSVLSKGILSVLLPSEDLGSATERTLLRSLLADVVLWKVVDKLSEPFMVHEIISKVIEKSLKIDPNSDLDGSDDPDATSNFEQKQQPQTTSLISSIRAFILSLMSFFSFLQAGLIFFISFARSVPDAPSRPPNSKPSPNSPSASLLTIALFPTIARLLNIGARQPWLMSTIELLALPLVSLPPGSIIDRLLAHFFKKYILTSQFACSTLAVSRQTLFPNNDSMAAPRPYPSDEEKTQILNRVHRNILRVVPARMRKQILGEDAREGVEELLSPFENKFANKHLLYFLFDIVIIKLLPEMAEMTPEELKEWRLGEDDSRVYV
ncbi:PXA domain-containing protein [Myxozyma melibiosi]|uniref:PXA domain-containing protein n=1 Tax=Myxozyma melibiosi TaxID=54550 RepID=A0ABR1FEV4_9ASCO